MKEVVQSVDESLENWKAFGITSASVLKKEGKCDDALQNFKTCFNLNVKRKVFEVVIINNMSQKRPVFMEDTSELWKGGESKSDHFSYVMSEVLFGNIQIQTKPVVKSGT